LGGLGLFYISNCYKSNFVSSLVELNFDKANKEGNKETNPIGSKVSNKKVETMKKLCPLQLINV
jgi:hypothetical protein